MYDKIHYKLKKQTNKQTFLSSFANEMQLVGVLSLVSLINLSQLYIKIFCVLLGSSEWLPVCMISLNWSIDVQHYMLQVSNTMIHNFLKLYSIYG